MIVWLCVAWKPSHSFEYWCMIETEFRALQLLINEHEIMIVKHVLWVSQFNLVETLLNVLTCSHELLRLRINELRSMTCNMRKDKFLTDWDNEIMS